MRCIAKLEQPPKRHPYSLQLHLECKKKEVLMHIHICIHPIAYTERTRCLIFNIYKHPGELVLVWSSRVCST